MSQRDHNGEVVRQRVNIQQQQNEQVKELLVHQQNQTLALTLPQPQMPVFSGDSIDYCNFKRAFESLIETKTSSENARLYYLIQYTSGEVQELMRSCLSMPPEKGYKAARQLLKSRYGQNYKIAVACITKVIHGPPIKAEDGPALERYSVLLTSCKNTLKEIGYINKIENSDPLQRIIEHLPFGLRQKWRDMADSITETEKREVTIEDVTNFVERKARVANIQSLEKLFRRSSTETRSFSDQEIPPRILPMVKVLVVVRVVDRIMTTSLPSQSFARCATVIIGCPDVKCLSESQSLSDSTSYERRVCATIVFSPVIWLTIALVKAIAR